LIPLLPKAFPKTRGPNYYYTQYIRPPKCPPPPPEFSNARFSATIPA